MWFTKDSNGFKAHFTVVRSNGTLRTGASAGFTVVVVDPSDTATSTPTVTETSGKAGMYEFTVPSAFLISNGTGEYGISVEIDITTSPKIKTAFSKVLQVSDTDLSDIQGDITTINTNIATLLALLVAADLSAAAGSTSTDIRTGATQADDFYDDMLIVVENSAGTVARHISSYTNLNGVFTLDTALPFTPAISDRVLVFNQNELFGFIAANAALIPAAL